jgi:hypothetical protein
VEQALAELGLALAGHRPKDSSSTGAGFFVIVVGAFASLVGWSAWSGWKQRKRYQVRRPRTQQPHIASTFPPTAASTRFRCCLAAQQPLVVPDFSQLARNNSLADCRAVCACQQHSSTLHATA